MSVLLGTCLNSVVREYVWEEKAVERICGVVQQNLNEGWGPGKGLIVQSAMGGGKSSLLKKIREFLKEHRCCVLDCSLFSLSDRGHVERDLHALTQGPKALLLLDNVDYLPSPSKKAASSNALTLSSLSFTSAVLRAVDSGNVTVIATCTDIDSVDVSLLQPYRLGAPIKLRLPDQTDRAALFERALNDSTLQLTCDHSEHTNIHSLCKELALRTHGFTSSDIYKLLREEYQKQLLHTPVGELVNISASQLLRAVSVIVPSALPAAVESEGRKFVRAVDYDASAPVLFGMEDVQNHLLRSVATVVPELAKQEMGWISPRKCSGIVLCGLSGSGKTALTEWLAHAVRRHCRFISVPCADLVHKVVGETERRLAEIFATARELSPCVVLLDNIDMLLGPAAHADPVQADWGGANKAGDGLKGGGSGDGSGGGSSSRGEFIPRSTRTRHQAVDRMLSTLLVEIDGLYTGHAGGAAAALSSWGSGAEQINGGLPPKVLVVVTTTTMSCLDRALIRPGRLEEHIMLQLPTQTQRETYLTSLLKRPHQSEDGQGQKENNDEWRRCIEMCAQRAAGRSYAHLRTLFQEANIAYARQQLRQGHTTVEVNCAECDEFVRQYLSTAT